ncbi:hypothetical protein ACTPGR_002437 [Enterococcus hirae]
MPDKEQNINKNNEEKVSIQSQDQRGFFYRLFNKYKFTKKKRTDLETSAALDKDLSKDHQASTEEIPSYLKSLLEEKNLLKQRNIEINSNNRTFFINYLNEKHRLNSNMPLSEETKAALIEDLDKFYYIPLKTSTCHNFIFDLNITRRELTRLKDDQFLKVNELIAQLTDDATIAITNKYQLLENHTVSEEKLEAIANEVMDLNLDEEMKRAVIAKLELLKEDRATLRKIYRKKQDTLKTQESKTDANLKEITKDDDEILFYQQVDDAAIAIINKYQLSIPENKLKAIADEIMDLNLSGEQKEEVIFQLGLQTEDSATLWKIYKINLMKAGQLFYQQANNAAIHATIAIINKYQLSENQSVPEEKLKAIVKEIMDLNLSEEYKREVIFELKISEEDRATLQTIYRERQDFLTAQESKTDAKIDENTKGEDKVSFYQQIGDAVIGIINKFQLFVSEEELRKIAKEILNLKLSEEQKKEVIIYLGIQSEYKDVLLEIFKELQRWPTPPQNKLEVIIRGAKALQLFNQLVHDSVTYITNKYQLSEDQATHPRKLKAIAKEIIDLNLSDEQKREVIKGLEIPEADREAFWRIYRKLEILPKKQESKTDSRVNGRTQDGYSDDKAQLIHKNKKQIVRRNFAEAAPFFFKGINDATIAITNKYQLSNDRPTFRDKLEKMVNEIIDLNLSEQQKRVVIRVLEISKEDRVTLKTMYRERQDLLKIQKNKTDDEVFFYHGVDDATLTIITNYQLSEDQPNPPKKLDAIANEILNLNLNKQQKREVIFELEIPEIDRDKLNELINKKTTLLNQVETLQESAKTNLGSTLSQGLNNLESKPTTPLQTSLKLKLRSLLKKSEDNLGSEPPISLKPNASKSNPLKRVNSLSSKPQTPLNPTIHLSKGLDEFSR